MNQAPNRAALTAAPNFDEVIDRVGTHSSKWDGMQGIYGVSPREGIAMWVADMDFRPPACVQRALEGMTQHGVYGYWGDNRDYHAAIQWWMATRHGWQVEPEWIFTTHGLVNGTALCVDAFTAPGDGVVLMTPVYHAFARVIRAAGRTVVECPLKRVDGRYEMDFDAWDAQMDGSARMMILCSPHNPGGRVWTADELRAAAEFARRHNLVLVSDEIHHDLVMPGGRKHIPMAVAEPDMPLVMMTATTKTFNVAGGLTGNVIIADPELRKRFGARMAAMGISPNSFGLTMATAAYSPEGAAWVDALLAYLDGNRKIFDAGVNAIPGLRSMPLEATYLAWVDFEGTGMAREEFLARVEKDAKIAVNHGATFGLGGEDFLRFNLATPRARVEEAVTRLQNAFADLQ
ncbi:pyridoxal phosphate-dependent aminotransferase [Sinirhodobacter sp. WL0062]|uniref:cysteine-S-conjugate beta-lyase n=1 Tax=Rhodobacter flavimaris TaxID=2907145 RepID=A0ABS8YXP6_9RHOB|nr:MalY/PatB family protein [Sinirhodobacter sp. WL0062]MCE5973352.1 pyridoxal phosphate-dependent aminotransferase [Sinirhodobacter sp. WL0062]